MTEKEKKILEEAQRISRNTSEDRAFAHQLDDFFSGTLSSEKVISVCGTPYSISLLSPSAKRVVIRQSDLKNAVDNHENKKHTDNHEIDREEVYALSEAIRTPIIILHGNTNNPNSIVLITDIKSKSNENVFVPISLDRQNGKINRITTLYGKKNLSDYLFNHEKDVFAINTEKADAFANIGVQFPKFRYDTVICFDNSIAYTMENVKYPLKKDEIMFRDCDLSAIIAKDSLAWDEITDIGYMMYSYNYRKEHIPSRIARFGLGGLPETELYSFLDRYEKGEDISKELVLGLSGLNVQNCIISVGDLSIYPDQRIETENGYKLTYGNVEREVTYQEFETAYIKLIKDEYDRVYREDELEQAYSSIRLYSEQNKIDNSVTNARQNEIDNKYILLAYNYDRETDTSYSAYADLDNHKLVRKYDRTIIERKYNSLDEMNHILLSDMSYNELLHPEPRALEQAIEYIADFCDEEYNTGNVSYKYPDKHDLHHISLAYTDLTDFEIPIHAYADLVDYKMIKEFGGDIIEVNQYNSLKEMNEEALCCLDFSDLVYVDSEIEEKYEQMYKQASYDRGEALKNLQLNISEYDLELPMNLIEGQHYEFEDKYTTYLGGIDLNGHERKDNIEESTKTMDISVSQEPYCANYIRLSSTENSNSAILYDPTKENELNELKKQISDFVEKSDKLMIYKFIGNDNSGFFTSPEIVSFKKESVIGTLSDNDDVGDGTPDLTGLGNRVKK